MRSNQKAATQCEKKSFRNRKPGSERPLSKFTRRATKSRIASFSARKPEPDRSTKIIKDLDSKSSRKRLSAARKLESLCVLNLHTKNSISERLLSLFEHLATSSPFADVRKESINAISLAGDSKRLRRLVFRSGCYETFLHRNRILNKLEFREKALLKRKVVEILERFNIRISMSGDTLPGKVAYSN
jgi:hypothetical protein